MSRTQLIHTLFGRTWFNRQHGWRCLATACLVGSLLAASIGFATFAVAAEPAAPVKDSPAKGSDQKATTADDPPAAEKEALFAKFTKEMTEVELVGHFTVTGKDSKELKEERYTITSVKKLPEGDKWEISTHIKYGKVDATVPLQLDVKWSGDTPVITLTDFTIPTMGTFSARVLIYEGRYAGTWQHGAVGGHLFGRVVKKAK